MFATNLAALNLLALNLLAMVVVMFILLALPVMVRLLVGWVRFKYFVKWDRYCALATERPVLNLHPLAEVYQARGFGYGPEEYYRDWAHCCRLKRNFASHQPKRVPVRIVSFTPKKLILLTTEEAKKTGESMFDCPSGNGYIFGKLFPKNTTITLEYNLLSDEYENDDIYYDPPNDWIGNDSRNQFYKEINVPLAITCTELFRQLDNRPFKPCTCDW